MISNEAENDHFLQILEDFERRIHRGEEVNPVEERVHDLIAVLVSDYEHRGKQVPDLKPVDALHFLLQQNELKPADQEEIDILSGRRKISVEKARALGERFRMNPGAFIEWD